MRFQIESTNFCPSGLAPRWTWWIRGIHGGPCYGIVGTDEQGFGLYIFQHAGDQPPIREALLNAEEFSLPPQTSRTEAQSRISLALTALGWDKAAA